MHAPQIHTDSIHGQQLPSWGQKIGNLKVCLGAVETVSKPQGALLELYVVLTVSRTFANMNFSSDMVVFLVLDVSLFMWL